MLRQLIDDHPGPSKICYLDVPLEETIRRHEHRPMTVGPDQLREWYRPLDLLGVHGRGPVHPARTARPDPLAT